MYFVSRNGVQQGPHSLEVINSMLSAGQFSAADLAWQEGMAQWEPLGSIPGVSAAGGPPPMPGGPPVMPGAYSPPRSNVDSQGVSAGPPITSGMAIASMVLGILAVILFWMILFWPWIPALSLGILAIIFGHVSRNKINSSRGKLGGGGLAVAGLTMGYIGIAIPILLRLYVAMFVGKVLETTTNERSELNKVFKEVVERAEKEQRDREVRLKQNP